MKTALRAAGAVARGQRRNRWRGPRRTVVTARCGGRAVTALRADGLHSHSRRKWDRGDEKIAAFPSGSPSLFFLGRRRECAGPRRAVREPAIAPRNADSSSRRNPAARPRLPDGTAAARPRARGPGRRAARSVPNVMTLSPARVAPATCCSAGSRNPGSGPRGNAESPWS